MRQFEISRTLFEKKITVQVFCLDQGIHVSVYGGELSHIGAVSIADPEGTITTTQFPTHKDAAVSEAFAKALLNAGCCPVVVETGIHYDHLSREDIQKVLRITDELIKETVMHL